MNRPYLRLALAVLVVGVALGLLSRLPRREPARLHPTPAAARIVVSVELGADGSVTTDPTSVPKGAFLMLRAVNLGTLPRTLSLSGYEERLRLVVTPGEFAHAILRADRPGSDLAWLVNGTPTGRFAVTGSHLEEETP